MGDTALGSGDRLELVGVALVVAGAVSLVYAASVFGVHAAALAAGCLAVVFGVVVVLAAAARPGGGGDR